MLERGHIATMYHKGSDSYAEVVVLRPMTKAEVMAELEASTGNVLGAKKILKDEKRIKAKVPVTDGEIFRSIALQVTGKPTGTVYTERNKARTTKRIKAYWYGVSTAQLAELTKLYTKAFGDRLIECGVNKPYDAGYGYATGGGDLIIRLKEQA